MLFVGSLKMLRSKRSNLPAILLGLHFTPLRGHEQNMGIGRISVCDGAWKTLGAIQSFQWHAKSSFCTEYDEGFGVAMPCFFARNVGQVAPQACGQHGADW